MSGRFGRLALQLVRCGKPEQLPGRELIAEAEDDAAGEFDLEQVGALALHEGRGCQQPVALAANGPGDRVTPGGVFRSLDDDLVAAEDRAAEVGRLVGARDERASESFFGEQ